AEWPLVVQLKWEHYHQKLLAGRSRMTPDDADSAYRAGTVRLFQHILIRVPPSAVPMVEEQQKKKAEGVLRQAAARSGAGFTQLARQYSEDPGSKARGGYLPATPRGQFVARSTARRGRWPPVGWAGPGAHRSGFTSSSGRRRRK